MRRCRQFSSGLQGSDKGRERCCGKNTVQRLEASVSVTSGIMSNNISLTSLEVSWLIGNLQVRWRCFHIEFVGVTRRMDAPGLRFSMGTELPAGFTGKGT